MEHTNHKLAVSLVTIVAIGGLAAFVLTNSHEAHQGKRTAPLVPTVDVAAESPRAAKLAAARKAEREAAEARIEQRLAEAEREGIAAAEQCLTRLRDLFRQARQGSRPFAEDALAFSSKWRLVADYLPFTPGNLHAEYLREAFEQHLFSSHQLGQRLEAAITEFQRTQQDIENRALIDIGADLESLKLQTVPPPSQQQLQQRIHDVLEQFVPSPSGWGFRRPCSEQGPARRGQPLAPPRWLGYWSIGLSPKSGTGGLIRPAIWLPRSTVR
jgi:hypothetical protein